MSGREREAALAELIGGLLDARRDPATERFDAELAAAEADGRIDSRTARMLRWWQREAQRAVVEHAKATLPAALTALERSATAAARATEEAARSWDRAESPAVAVPPSQPYTGPTAPRRLLVAGLSPATDAAVDAAVDRAGARADDPSPTRAASSE